MSEFKGKTVLITGAGRGIGATTARRFANAGANVVINYAHAESSARQLAAEIEASGGSTLLYQADIAQALQVNAMVEKVISTFGGCDVLVNNAGLSIDKPFIELEEADFDAAYQVNLKGPFLLSQAVARKMLASTGGVIVNVSSNTSFSGRPNAANYLSTKAGLNMLTKCMALELGPKIRVNGLGLGFVDSDLVRQLYADEAIENVKQTTPLGRMTSAGETAEFILLLASSKTAFVTGQTIVFDGGRVMR